MLMDVDRKSTRPEIALVEPVGADQSSCSRSAIVIAVSRIPSRKTAIIMAEDLGLCLTLMSWLCWVDVSHVSNKLGKLKPFF